jgi:hypothetical protein
VLVAVGRGAETAYDVACAIAPRDPHPDHRQLALSVVLTVLPRLVRAGRVARFDEDGVERYTLRVESTTKQMVEAGDRA